MDFSRRHLLGTGLGIGAAAGLASAAATTPAHAAAGAVDARDHGVVPHGGGDQTEALGRALSAAIADGVPLFLPAGDYAVAGLEIRAPVEIRGVPGATVLRKSGRGPLVAASGLRGVTLSGLVLDGGYLPLDDMRHPAVVAFREVQEVRIDACRVRASTATGIALDRSSGWITASSVIDCAYAGVFAIDSRGLEIAGNHVADCGNNGIMVWRSVDGEDGTIVSGNRVERIRADDGGTGQNGNGINMFRAANVIVAGNRVADCAFSAVRSNAGSACQIVANSCARLGEVALYAEFGFEGAIIAQNIVETAASGVSITNFDYGGRLAVCQGNIIRDLFIREGDDWERGVGISAEADTVVEGNVVENAPVTGIALGWGEHLRDLAATNNIVRNCRRGITFSTVEGAGQALIANNLISRPGEAAIVGMRWSEVATGDIGLAPEEAPAHVTVTGNRVV